MGTASLTQSWCWQQHSTHWTAAAAATVQQTFGAAWAVNFRQLLQGLLKTRQLMMMGVFQTSGKQWQYCLSASSTSPSSCKSGAATLCNRTHSSGAEQREWAHFIVLGREPTEAQGVKGTNLADGLGMTWLHISHKYTVTHSPREPHVWGTDELAHVFVHNLLLPIASAGAFEKRGSSQ